MLKRNLVALNKAPCFLLNLFLQTNISFQIINSNYLSKLAITLTGFLPLVKKVLFTIFSLQRKPKNKLSLLLRSATTLLPLALFLFLTPHTMVQANWEERVIPAPSATINKISSEIIAEKIPSFLSPVHGYLSTYFSLFHPGIDIPNPLGSPTFAAEKGTVVFEGWTTSGHGNLVIIRHNSGFETHYAHLSTISVKEGQIVSQGDLIGKVGSTGNSTGSHLHFELHQNGVAQNPLKYFKP